MELQQHDENLGASTERIAFEQTSEKPLTVVGSDFLSGNQSVETVVLPDTVKAIEKSAFNSCTKLRTLHIPASVEAVGEFAFANCINLTEITCAEDNPAFSAADGALFDKEKTTLLAAPAVSEYTVPSTVRKIADYAFYFNTNLTSVTIPPSVEEIGDGAFGDCSKLSEVVIEDNGLKKLGNSAFRNTRALAGIALPASISSVGANAFVGTSPEFKLSGPVGSSVEAYAKQAHIPFVASAADGEAEPCDEVKDETRDEIQPEANDDTQAKVRDEVQEEVEPEPAAAEVKEEPEAEAEIEAEVEAEAETEVEADSETITVDSLLYTVTKSGAVQLVGSDLSKKKLTGTVKVPATIQVGDVVYKVTSIKDLAFKGYEKIEAVEMGAKVKKVGAAAFRGCTKLAAVSFGKGLTSIGAGAFGKCKSLKTIDFASSKVKKIGKGAFKGISEKAVATVPAKQAAAYAKLLKKAGAPSALKMKKK